MMTITEKLVDSLAEGQTRRRFFALCGKVALATGFVALGLGWNPDLAQAACCSDPVPWLPESQPTRAWITVPDWVHASWHANHVLRQWQTTRVRPVQLWRSSVQLRVRRGRNMLVQRSRSTCMVK